MWSCYSKYRTFLPEPVSLYSNIYTSFPRLALIGYVYEIADTALSAPLQKKKKWFPAPIAAHVME